MEVIGFIPARAGSERVPQKNTRPFAGFEHGLLELKLRQMTGVAALDEIVVSSNDPAVLDYAALFARDHDSRVTPLERPEEYGTSATSMAAFTADYIAHLRPSGLLFWTHVTHPLVTAALYTRILDAYRVAKAEGYDSLVTVTRHQKFFWRDGRPFNYDPEPERWPRSQDLTPLFEINHAVYAIEFPVMRAVRDRVGTQPQFFELEETDALDIDWQPQFDLLQDIVTARRARGLSVT